MTLRGTGLTRCSRCNRWADRLADHWLDYPKPRGGRRTRRFCSRACLVAWCFESGYVPVDWVPPERLEELMREASLASDPPQRVPSDAQDREEHGGPMALNPSDRPPGRYVRDGHVFYPVGVTVSAGWYDEKGRQYDATFRLVCTACGHASGEADAAGEGRGKVTTDTRGRTWCRDCRYQADVLGVDPEEHGAHEEFLTQSP